jgi:hypothetical protein
MPDEVVIVADDGTEHVFPAGFDPKRAAAIVRGQAQQRAPGSIADRLHSGIVDQYGPGLAAEISGSEVMGQPLLMTPGIVSVARAAVPGVLSMASKAGAYVNSPVGRRLMKGAAKEALRIAGWGAGSKIFD